MKNPLSLIIFLFLLTAFNYLFAQAPLIKYAGPQNYLVGTAITPLAPSNTRGAVPVSADGSVVTTLAGSLSFPVGVAVDKSGNVYVGDEGDGLILKISPAGLVTTLAGNGNPSPGDPPFTVHDFFGPDGVAVDKFGNVYVDDTGDFALKVVNPGGSVSTLVSNIAAMAIAVDTSGNVFVANAQLIGKISPGGVITVVAGTGFIGALNGPAALASFKNPRGVVVDASGNVYVGDSDNNLVRKISAAGVVTTLAGSGAAGSANGIGTAATFNSPRGLAVDAAGNVYVADYGNNQIRKITPAGVVTTLAGDGSAGYQDGIGEQAEFGNISCVAVDASGNVYAADTENGAIRKIIPVGYTVSPALPTGLVIDAATGIISGTPTTVSLATGYTVVASNTGGSASATFSIKVTSGALNIDSLHNLTISSGFLAPAFASNTTGYTASVGNAVNSITVTPTAVNSAAKITVNGTPVASGSASAAITLSVGANTITTMVTSQDGTATMTYSIVVKRAPSANAALAHLTISSGTLSPAFASSTASYTASTANATTSITITPTTADSTATIKVDGASTLSGSHSASIPLSIGANTITIIVTAQDGTTKNTYSVTVTRVPASVPDLANLTISSGKLTPSFATTTFNYTATAGRTISSITLTPTARVATFIITVNGTIVPSGSPSPAISLVPGVNTITIDVNTRDGIVTGVYKITVTREGGTTFANANISGLDNFEDQTDSLRNDNVLVHPAISPNGDGINDVLTIDNIGNYPDNNVTLIDMSGKAIYKIAGYDNVNKVFNGHSNITGALQQPGTYFYLLEYKVNGENTRKTGFFVLRY